MAHALAISHFAFHNFVLEWKYLQIIFRFAIKICVYRNSCHAYAATKHTSYNSFSVINIQFISVYGQWNVWSAFSACSLSCGLGTMKRKRYCDKPLLNKGGNDCPGESEDTKECMETMICPRKDVTVHTLCCM